MAFNAQQTECDVIERLMDGFTDMNRCHQVALKIMCNNDLLGEYYEALSKLETPR